MGQSMSPVVNERAGSTPCHSGDNHASGWTASGSCETGKKVPENRNNGTMPSRMMIEKLWSVSIPPAYAASGAANASAVRMATGTASTPHHDTMPPSATATITKATAEIARSHPGPEHPAPEDVAGRQRRC